MKWDVYATVVGGKFIGSFDVETGEEALDLAAARASVSVCHQCSREVDNPEIDHMVASCGSEEVSDETDEGWRAKARDAGWRPPASAVKLSPTDVSALRELSTVRFTRPEGVPLRTLSRLHERKLVARRWCGRGSILVARFRLSPAGRRALLSRGDP